MTVVRKIIHIDMDAFYASIEVRDNPQLAGKPVAVGGASSSRGVIATCNYEARKFGVHSAMPSGEALRLCPHLVLLNCRMKVYKSVSQQIQSIFHHYSDRVEPLSLDEAYLDVTENKLLNGSAILLAEKIRKEVYLETGLTASAGIASNKFLAKVASDINKPNGQFAVTPQQSSVFASSLPLRKIPGVGPKTDKKLAEKGLTTGYDILQCDANQLLEWFGNFGLVLKLRAQGVDERPVEPNRVRKSVGVETTLAKDLVSADGCFDTLQDLIPELLSRLNGRAFRGLNVKIKFEDFQQTTISQQVSSLELSTLYAMVKAGYMRGEGRRVRLIGLSVNLTKGPLQLGFAF
jgi:DNA polymerase-4